MLKKQKSHTLPSKMKTYEKYFPYLILLAAGFIIFSFFAPAIFGNSNGIEHMIPFIAIAAAILTFLAFLIQHQANVQLSNDNKKQQLERQFYEMLKIHCDNVKNLHAESLYTDPTTRNQSQKTVNGQDFFRCLLEEFDLIYSKIYESEKTGDIFNKAYRTFFFGIDSAARELKKETVEAIRSFVFQNSNTLVWLNHPKLIPVKDSLFTGRMDQLVPYYRHLFLMVKTVVQFKDDLFSYEDKRQFLRILRAQLSSAEQVLLYYNWKSGCGEKWEEDSSKPGGNHFFTDYRIIHNIIPKDCWVFSSDEILQSLLEKNPDYQRLNDEDTLFELI